MRWSIAPCVDTITTSTAAIISVISTVAAIKAPSSAAVWLESLDSSASLRASTATSPDPGAYTP
eukprot:6499933-Lingulodinium_polyedra.AAC.1